MTEENKQFRTLVDQVTVVSPADVAQTKTTIQRTLASLSARPVQRHLRPWHIGVASALIALVLLTIGGIVNPTMNRALAQAPIVGQFFARFSDGDALSVVVQNNGRSERVHGQATVNGLTLTLESAYVEGQTVGIEGIATGVPAKKDDWFDVKLGTQAPASFETKSTEVRKLGKNRYYFALFGTLSVADSRRIVYLPLTIDRFAGYRGPWQFSFKLTPSRSTTTLLSGQAQLPNQTQLTLTQYTRYSGGTGLLTLQQSTPDGQSEISIRSIKPVPTGAELLLNANPLYLEGTKYGEQKTVVGYRIKQYPAGIKNLYITGDVDGRAYAVTIPVK